MTKEGIDSQYLWIGYVNVKTDLSYTIAHNRLKRNTWSYSVECI